MLKKYSHFILALTLFCLFFIISLWTPLAGDDWGYALNGMASNPFVLAFDFFFSWSGRFFSELYGFLVAPNKWVWNLLNPALFTLIYLCILKIVHPKQKWLSFMLLLVWILSVKDELRMETYSWIMGTTYVIPLAISLLIVALLKPIRLLKTKAKFGLDITVSILLFWAGMTMENISIVLVFWMIGLTLLDFGEHRKINWQWVRWSIISLVSFSLLRLSPGANFRLERDHPAFNALSLVEKLASNYPLFIQHTFLDHKIFILSFTLILTAVILFSNKLNRPLKTLFSFILSFALLSSVSLTLASRFPHELWTMFTSAGSWFNLTYWVIYTIILLIVLIGLLEDDDRKLALFFFLGAGLANGAMLLSPIFGYRSSLYTLYFMFVVGLLLIKQLDFKKLTPLILILLTALAVKSSLTYITKYNLVRQTHTIRMEQIQYYRDHPETEEAWLIRYPIFTIHSGDIEEWDSYHMEVFKKYYGLDPDMHLVFYYPE